MESPYFSNNETSVVTTAGWDETVVNGDESTFMEEARTYMTFKIATPIGFPFWYQLV